MKQFILLLIVSIISFKSSTQSLTPIDKEIAEKMIRKYSGFLAGHGKTDALVILNREALEIAMKNHKDDIMSFYFARTLKNQNVEEDGIKKRPTLIVKFTKSAKSGVLTEPVYYYLGSISNLCPEPPCIITEQ